MIFSDLFSEKFRFGNHPKKPLLYSIILINSFTGYFTIIAPVNLGEKWLLKVLAKKEHAPKNNRRETWF